MKNFKNPIKKLIPFLKPYGIPFIGAILFIIGAAIINAITPRTEGLIITRLTQDVLDMAKGIEGAGVSFTYIIKVLIILGILYLLSTLATYIASFLLTNAIQNTVKDLRNAIQNKIKKLPISYFDQNSYGDVLSRITNDIDTISNAMQQSFSQIINAILSLTLALGMMYAINVKMALVATLIIPLSYFVSRFIVGKSQQFFYDQQKSLGKLNGAVQEMYTGFNEIKLYGKQEDAIEDFEAINEELCHTGFKAQFISSIMSPIVSLISYLGIAAIGTMGGVLTLRGALTVGNLQAFIRYIWQVSQPLTQMTQLSSAIQSAFAAATRVFEFLEEEEEVKDI